MALNSDTLKLIQDTAVAANSIARRITHIDGDPKHIFRTIDESGSLGKLATDPDPMNSTMFDFVSLIGMAKSGVDKPVSVSLWYSEYGVTLVIGADGRGRANLNLSPSAAFKTLRDWDKTGGFSMSHKGIYQALRTTFAGCLPNHPDLKTLIARVDISKVQQLKSEQTKTKVSLDRSMMSEAAGAEKLPDVLNFMVPAFAQPIAPVTVNVRVAFELDADEAAFKFVVLPQEINAAVDESEDYVESKIINAIGSITNPGVDPDKIDRTKIDNFLKLCASYRGRP